VTEPRWLTVATVLAIHADQIEAHGGTLGLRDRGLLEAALDRPRNRFHYEPDADLCDLAASCSLGIAKNHPFIDGNKRVAFQAMYVLLGLNGPRITAEESDVVSLMLSVASGATPEPELADWLRNNTAPR
jgi:death-on-curing protein